MTKHKDEFAPFTTLNIEKYLRLIKKSNTWGGEMELSALSRKREFNAIVHQPREEPLIFQNFRSSKVPVIHLSYHNKEHYNSVRLGTDNGKGKAQPILAIEEEEEVVVKKPPKKKQLPGRLRRK